MVRAKGYKLYTNGNQEQLEQCSDYIKKLNQFAQVFLPKMNENMKMSVEIDGSYQSTIYIYGYKDIYEDEIEFNRLNTKDSMISQVGRLFNSVIGKAQSVWASTYWDSKVSLGFRRTVNVTMGPYVQLQYDEEIVRNAEVEDEVSLNDDEVKEMNSVNTKVDSILEGKDILNTLMGMTESKKRVTEDSMELSDLDVLDNILGELNTLIDFIKKDCADKYDEASEIQQVIDDAAIDMDRVEDLRDKLKKTLDEGSRKVDRALDRINGKFYPSDVDFRKTIKDRQKKTKA